MIQRALLRFLLLLEVPERHQRILDVGCGAGQTLVASRLDAQVTAIGIDRDFGALKLGRHIDGRVSFICARGETLPLASSFFDLVVSRVSLPYMNTRAALSEMTRVLAPGGSVWLALHPYERIAGELKAALKANPSLEHRRRLEALLRDLEESQLSPEELRHVRAVQVLETLASPAARQALGELARGPADALLTREANAALKRLGR